MPEQPTGQDLHRANGRANDAPAVIRVRGARVHNLQNIDLDIPRDCLVVVTGLSGSGKSSLAFDTLFADGQRQYIESLSVYARQFFDQLERPDVDLIEGLQPTVAIEQRAGTQNPRSTVATVTEIYDYMRLLWARVGEAHCYRCGAVVRQQTAEQIVDDIMALPPRTKAMILAPLVRGRKGRHKEVFEAVRKQGFVRVRVDGQLYDVDQVPELVRQRNHDIEAVVDRIVVREGVRPRVAESVRLSLKNSDGLVIVTWLQPDADDTGHDQWRQQLFSTRYACPNCKLGLAELEPRTFSFNSPYGACPACDGLGYQVQFDPDLILPDPTLSLAQGAIAPWRGEAKKAHVKRIQQALRQFAPPDSPLYSTPLRDWKPADRQRLVYGDGTRFPGLIVLLQQQYATQTDADLRQCLDVFRGRVPCRDCNGARLRDEARAVYVAGRPIHEVTALSVEQAKTFFDGLAWQGVAAAVAEPLVREIGKRLDFLLKVGLGYLNLDRPADTLSGGESQRIRLATGLGSGLVGVCYILDEPSIGLHHRDNDRLIAALNELKQQGNSVLVVEHDEATMRAADWLIDLGPGAGSQGGRVVAQGTPDQVARNPNSLTGRCLCGQTRIEVPATRRPVSPKRTLVIEGAATHNLKNVTARFPLGVLLCVTGVSGSGKSSLVNETLVPALARKLGNTVAKPGPYQRLRGAELVDKLIRIDQSPIGRSPRSNLATYSGAWDEIRRIFAGTRDARLRGFGPSRFSFNTSSGRCEACQGQGVNKIEMKFLPDLYVTCSVCRGARFNRQTLSIKYRGQSIADVLEMSVNQALAFFENFASLTQVLTGFADVGLGYLKLGQASTTLSGGEAQRIKLATELARPSTGGTLYVLDEPTTGLHFEDVRRLLAVLTRLVDLGNSVIVIEHNLDVVKSADWIIDLGPEGGEHGGQIVAVGTPEDVARVEASFTGRYLRPMLARSPSVDEAAQ
jgi:excinuclease ABC subunit A